MPRRIPHSRPALGVAEERAVIQVLRSGDAGAGPEVGAFERELEKRVGGRATAVQTGSAALHLALLGLGVTPGDRVVLPTYCCAAVLNAVRYTGAEPVLADVDPATANLDPDDVKRRLKAKTAAMIVPHMFGRPAPVRDLARPGVPVIEDCAMALGGPVGKAGAAAIYSFYATKMIATGHGGAVVMRDRRAAARVRDLVDYDNRDDYAVRYNYRMSGLVAALGRVQLGRVEGFVKRRRRIAEEYLEALEGGRAERGHVYYRFVVLAGSRDRFVRRMSARSIACKRPVYRPLHTYFPRRGKEFPGADELHRRVVSVPLYPALTAIEVRRVARALREVAADDDRPLRLG